MNCEQCNLHLEEFLAGELADAEKQEFLSHITVCDTCKESLKNTALIWNLVHAGCTSSCNKVLNDEAVREIEQVLNEPGALHLKQKMEQEQWQEKLNQIKKRKILLQAAAVLVIMISSGIFLAPDIFKSQPSKLYLDSVAESTAGVNAEDVNTFVLGKVQESSSGIVADSVENKASAPLSSEVMQKPLPAPEKKTLKTEKDVALDSLPAVPADLKSPAVGQKITEAAKQKTPSADNDSLRKKSAVPEIAATPAVNAAGQNVVPVKESRKYLQQVVQLPDKDGTLLVYAEMILPDRSAADKKITVELEQMQKAGNVINLTEHAGFMSFYKADAMSDQNLGYVVLTDAQNKSSKLPLSAKNTVSFERALPRVQAAFIQQYLMDPAKVKITADSDFLLALIRAAEKQVHENSPDKEQLEKALSALYQIISE